MAYEEKYPLALKAGTVLAGQYVIERVLGQGGFGITYAASDHKTGQRVAVKEFFPDSMATRMEHTTVMPFTGERGDSFSYGKDCFLKEAETLAQFIGNDNIVRIHSYFEENGTAYFVMDYVEGNSFDVYIRKQGGKISFEDAKRILVPIMDALGAVHAKGIVHRDVTPDNIYITTKGTVKLLDFGAARYSLGDKSRSLDVVLKHGFAPKEQYTRRGKQGPYTDVYALGATFYYALTGRRPPDSVERMEEDDLVPPSSLGVRLPEASEQAILMALNVAAQERFQSMAAFKQALLESDAIEAQNAAPQQPVQQQPLQQQAPQQQAQKPVQGTGTQGFDMLLGKPAPQPQQQGGNYTQTVMNNLYGQGTGQTNMMQRQTELIHTGQTVIQQPLQGGVQPGQGTQPYLQSGFIPQNYNQTVMQQANQNMMQQPLQGGVQPGQGTQPYLQSGVIPQNVNQTVMQQANQNMMQQPLQGGVQAGQQNGQQNGPTQAGQNVTPGGAKAVQQPAGGAVPPAGQNPPQKQASGGGNKKTGLIIGIAAAAVVLIGLIIGGVIFFTKSDKPDDDTLVAANTPTPIPTSTPTPTHAPTKAPDPTRAPEPTGEPTLAVQQAALDKYPRVANVNNVQNGSYLDWDPASYMIYLCDYNREEMYFMDIENEDVKLVNSSDSWSISCADGTAYFVSGGHAYTADITKGDKTLIPELQSYNDIALLYVSDQAYYVYRFSDAGTKVSRVDCVARNSGALVGSVSLGFESGDADTGKGQFTFCNGYFYYVLQSNDGHTYNTNAPIKVWRVPAGDFSEAPYAILQDSSADKQKYRQLFAENSNLFLLLDNPDGRCGIVMFDTVTEKIQKNVNWGSDTYYFNFINIYNGKMYVYADIVGKGYSAILTMNVNDDKYGTPVEFCKLDDVDYIFSMQLMSMEGDDWLIYYGEKPDGKYRMVIYNTEDVTDKTVLIGE